jgi:hypothetical protein
MANFIMKKLFLMLVLVIVGVGCGKDPVQVIKECEIDEAFKSHAELFYSYSYKQDCVPIKFTEGLSQGTNEVRGICDYENKIVEINPDLYNEASELRQEMIILHELGHCVLNLMHNNTTIYFRDENNELIVTGISLMHESLFIDERYYEKNKDKYLSEFSTPKKREDGVIEFSL